LAQLILGSFSDGGVLPWLTIPSPERMPSVTWSAVGMAQALRETRRKADLIHLSNILDWLSPPAAGQVLDLAWTALRPGGLVIVRQLNSRLDIPALGGRFDWLGGFSRDLTSADRSVLYRAVLVGRKN
jgi:S-adenosylmethionine-diacylglycerol 3-amino-3-carboxypropyl transferase